jgi:hypothetical protein
MRPRPLLYRNCGFESRYGHGFCHLRVLCVVRQRSLRRADHPPKYFEPKSFSIFLSSRFLAPVEKSLKFDQLIPTVADQTKRIYIEIKSLPRHFSDLERANSD